MLTQHPQGAASRGKAFLAGHRGPRPSRREGGAHAAGVETFAAVLTRIPDQGLFLILSSSASATP